VATVWSGSRSSSSSSVADTVAHLVWEKSLIRDLSWSISSHAIWLHWAEAVIVFFPLPSVFFFLFFSN
jgi:hypothetical protein